MFLQSPASYVSLAALKADTTLDLTDKNGNPIADTVLSTLLEEASGDIDSMIGQSFLPQEVKIRKMGEGTNFLILGRRPVIYVRQVKIVLPNSVGFDVPVQSLLVDFEAGILQNMTPLTFQGIGVTTLFPKNLPIDVTLGYGLGYPIPPPAFTAAPSGMFDEDPLSAGPHTVQVTSVTYSGESLPSAAQTVTLAEPGAITGVISNAPGAMRYYVYVDGTFACETQGYAIGDGPYGTIGFTVDATPSTDVIAFNFDGTPKTLPTIDTSAAPLQGRFAGLRKATKLKVQQVIWESKNPSNQGIAAQQSGPKRVQFKDNLQSIITKALDDLVDALSYQGF